MSTQKEQNGTGTGVDIITVMSTQQQENKQSFRCPLHERHVAGIQFQFDRPKIFGVISYLGIYCGPAEIPVVDDVRKSVHASGVVTQSN